MIILNLILGIGISLVFYIEHQTHQNKINKIERRVHVNGIRGKTSVTRLLAAVLRDSEKKAFGKVTGTNARLINHQGEDTTVTRRGPANVFENVKTIKNHIPEDAHSIVFECMAIKPEYQKFLEEKVINSHVGVITNIREDHMEELGYTLEEIAKSLSGSIPRNGHLVCGESNPKIQEILKEECAKKKTVFVNALDYKISDNYHKNFPYYEHKENMSIGLAVADIYNIPRNQALAAMKTTRPDSGVLEIKEFSVDNNQVTWCNLFAINDRESTIKNFQDLEKLHNKKQQKKVVAILNNRSDRPDRAQQFIDIVKNDLRVDLVVTFGDFEKQALRQLKGHKEVLPMASVKDLSGKEILQKIIATTGSQEIMLYGLANIHTPQAEKILKYFEETKEESPVIKVLIDETKITKPEKIATM